jgi:ketosteroid isomerase-like protein
MSANLDLVRSIYADWERGDFSRVDWAHPEIEFMFADGPEPGRWVGLAGMSKAFGEWLSPWEDFRVEVAECRAVGDERVLAMIRRGGRGKTSQLDVEGAGALVFHLRESEVTRLVLYNDRERALADLGLEE